MTRAIVITVSDSRTRGDRQDLSGPAVVQLLESSGFTVAGVLMVPDERDRIEAALREQAARFPLIITTGGTGVAPRDVTPEATLAVCDRTIPGIPERMRSAGSEETPLAYLSRGVAGTLGRSLILNLPGSPQGAVTSLGAVLHLVKHAIALLKGEDAGHANSEAWGRRTEPANSEPSHPEPTHPEPTHPDTGKAPAP